MARTFDSSSDKITTALSASSTQRSIGIWAYRTGDGGGGFGRMCDRALSTDNELLWCDGPSNKYEYQIRWSGAQARWTIPKPSDNAWHHVLVTYDGSSTANDPKIYLNGALQTVTRLVAPSGTIATASGNYIIGNRDSTANRGWDGYLAEFAVWDRILSSTEAAAIGTAKKSALWYPDKLACYLPLKYDLRDWARSVFATDSGTAHQAHPTIYEAASYLL